MRLANETHRRGVIAGVGLALLSLQVLPSAARAAAPSPAGGPPSAGALIIRSGQGFVPHTHDLWIPYAVLSAPPREGVTLTSTLARGHTHEVAFSHDELVAVHQGGTVSVKGGSHTFVVAIALAVRDQATQTQGRRA
ncbi:hypothetical protein [Phenylobacterium sp.]|uniref:hypothetical protein n=1 Tax=Phenylobacterium sp. TaxID=1871053 RepID=UPI003BA8A282